MKKLTATTCAILVFVLILAALGPARPAGAAEDGGARSVFARGAGERALSLGGAYGAVDGDPTTLYWNPAGLADLSRTSLAVSHTNLIGMGFYEQYGTVALPSWRLGTFAISLRRFGVDGIEGRDSRGTVTDTDLNNSESELALGYARGFGGAWKVGAALKMQRQDLAGNSGGGLGLDAGVIVRPALVLGSTSAWADDLSLGLTFRNLVEPTIRLAEDDVRDPSGIRLGAAFATALGDHFDAVLMTDVEKTKDMDTDFHAGVEVTLMEILALRLGSNAGTLTAGLGTEVRGIEAHYTFEDNPLETVHRFGLIVGFGKTVEERRLADMKRRETELHARLAKAFADEEQQRIAATVAAIESNLDAGRYESALAGVRTLDVMAPDHPASANLEAAALYGLGRRSEAAGEIAGALVAYQDCLLVNPSHTEARAGLERVTAAGQRRAQHDDQVRDLSGRAMQAYAEGDLETARELYARAIALAPGDSELVALAGHVDDAIGMRAEIAEAQAAARAAAASADAATGPSPRTEPTGTATGTTLVAAAPSFADLPEIRRNEIADLYERGVTAAKAGRRDDAIRYWELVWNAAPDYQNVAGHLKQEYQARGMDAFAEGRLDRAVEIWEQALAVDPADERTQGYLERAHEHRARIRKIRDSGR
jgi:tetratricopeptide (TPR) repeat protein